MNKIFFHDFNANSGLKFRREFKNFLSAIFRRYNIAIDRVDFIFCTDEYLLTLNQQFLGHNYYTDTLSFVLSRKKMPITGEVYLSIDRIKSNANQLSIPYQTELKRVIIHGTLHLCGYLDKPKKLRQIMEDIQEKYLNSWIVSRETQIGD